MGNIKTEQKRISQNSVMKEKEVSFLVKNAQFLFMHSFSSEKQHSYLFSNIQH